MVKGGARSAPYFAVYFHSVCCGKYVCKDVAVEVARAISRLDGESWLFDYQSNKITYFVCGRKHR